MKARKAHSMKNRINIQSLALGAVFGAAVVFSLGAATEHKKQEYRQIPNQVSDESLNKAADEGWTVVCTGTSHSGMFYVLTRTRP
jgi:hypothetical protein